MGREHCASRKQVCLSLVILMFMSVSCALWRGPHGSGQPAATNAGENIARKLPSAGKEQPTPGEQREQLDDVNSHLATARELFMDRDYAPALKEYETALSLSVDGPAAEEALFFTGLIWAHPANPRRDDRKSVFYLKKIVEQREKSAFAEQARVVLYILSENRKAADKIRKLRTLVERLGEVDITTEAKKKVERR